MNETYLRLQHQTVFCSKKPCLGNHWCSVISIHINVLWLGIAWMVNIYVNWNGLDTDRSIFVGNSLVWSVQFCTKSSARKTNYNFAHMLRRYFMLLFIETEGRRPIFLLWFSVAHSQKDLVWWPIRIKILRYIAYTI